MKTANRSPFWTVLESWVIPVISVFWAPKSAEFTEVGTDIGIIDVLVVDEIGIVAVQSLPHDICHVTQGKNIVGLVEFDSVLNAEPFVGTYFIKNSTKTGFLYK